VFQCDTLKGVSHYNTCSHCAAELAHFSYALPDQACSEATSRESEVELQAALLLSGRWFRAFLPKMLREGNDRSSFICGSKSRRPCAVGLPRMQTA